MGIRDIIGTAFYRSVRSAAKAAIQELFRHELITEAEYKTIAERIENHASN